MQEFAHKIQRLSEKIRNDKKKFDKKKRMKQNYPLYCRFFLVWREKLIKIGVGKKAIEREIKSLDELFGFKKNLMSLCKNSVPKYR